MALGLTVDINANLARFEEQMNRLGGNLDGFQKKAESMSSGVNKALGALGVGISVAGIASFVKSGIDAADALNDMADRTGIAVEKLAGFQLATKLADTDMEAFSKSANKLSIFIAKNSEEMAKLGVSAKDPAEAFLQFADVFSQIEDPQRRAALGAAVLGKSYAEMAPLLLQGGEALRQQVKDGQEMSGVTAEQAKAAADFNDKLDAMSHHLSTVSMTVAGPVVDGFNQLIDRINNASKAGVTFNSVLTGIGDFAFGRLDDDIERIGTLSDKLDGINEKIVKAREHLANARSFPLVSDAYQEEADKKLNALLFERKGIILSLNNARSKSIVPQSTVDSTVVNNLIKQGDESEKSGKKAEAAALRATNAEASRAAGIATLISNLQFEIDLSGMSADEQSRLSAIRSGTAKATEAEAESIKKLINIKYDLLEADQIVADGEKLAAKQRSDMAGDYDRLSQKFNGLSIDFNKNLADALDARHTLNPETGLNIIPNDAELKKVLDKMGQDYNDLTSNAEKAAGQMSEFAVQAARNMQSSFADFLFDPFQDGIEGMGANFVKILQRMVAEAASAQIFEVLLGKNYGADNASGGLLQAGFAGLSSIFGGFFDGGSASVAVGNSEAFSSAMASSNFWSSTPGFASGGNHAGGWRLVGEQGPELEYTGPSRIFSADQTRSMLNANGDSSSVGSSVVNQVTIHVESGKNDSPDETGRRIGEAFIRTIARDEINSAARPGNRLNPTTKF